MSVKIIFLVVFLLLIIGSSGQGDEHRPLAVRPPPVRPSSSARRCYQCAESNMEQCNRFRRQVTCRTGYNFCFTFNGTVLRQGFAQPYVEKGCGYRDTCNILQQRPDLTTTNCSVCQRNRCNSSSLMSSNPVMVIALLAIVQKIVFQKQ